MDQKHSGLGVASFIISIVAGGLQFLLLVVAGVMQVSTPGGMDKNSVAAVLVGLFIFAFLFVSLVALALGIGGLVQKDRKKVFAILGTVFSAGTIVGMIAIILLGLAMGGGVKPRLQRSRTALLPDVTTSRSVAERA